MKSTRNSEDKKIAEAGPSNAKNSAIRLQFQNFLKTRKRKLESSAEPLNENLKEEETDKETENEEEKLRKKAVEVLTREAKSAALRASVMGAQGWVKPTSLNTNKRFLARTLKSAELSRKDHNKKRKKEKPKGSPK